MNEKIVGDKKPVLRGLTDVIDEISRDQQVRGFKGRSAEEIEADLRDGDAEYEQKMQSLQSDVKL